MSTADIEFGERLERRLERIERALHLLAVAVMRDQNELNALLRLISQPNKALSSTKVTVL